MITDKNKAIEDFQKAFLEEYGSEIDRAKASELAQNLLNLYEIIYRPLKGGGKKKTTNKYLIFRNGMI